jgi:hypothetical protein
VGEDLIGPSHLRAVAATATAVLEPAADQAGWDAAAGELRWTCRRTLDHLPDALFYYAAHLARRAEDRVPSPRDGDPQASIPTLVAAMTSAAAILSAVAEASGPEVRAFHPAGMADRSGFCAMGADEILVHTHDITVGLGMPFEPPAELCEPVCARLFPWAPSDGDPWSALLWANGRRVLPGHERLDPDWGWHCAPLSEWDGSMSRRRMPPRWS